MKCNNDCLNCPLEKCKYDAEGQTRKKTKLKGPEKKPVSEARKGYLKAWKEAHKEEIKVKHAAYFQENKAQIYAQRKEYYAENSEQILANARAWRLKKKIMNGDCANCHCSFHSGTILKYKGKLFCSDDCLKEYLINKVELDIEEIDYTEETEVKPEWSENYLNSLGMSKRDFC